MTGEDPGEGVEPVGPRSAEEAKERATFKVAADRHPHDALAARDDLNLRLRRSEEHLLRLSVENEGYRQRIDRLRGEQLSILLLSSMIAISGVLVEFVDGY